MRKILATISTTVPLTIFNGKIPRINEKVVSIFNSTEDIFYKRYNEIISFLKEKYPNDELTPDFSKENILGLFKAYFFEQILNEAISICFSYAGIYDDVVSIISYYMLTKEKLEEAIMGKPMIDAFGDVIKNQNSDSAFDAISKGSTLLLLNAEFLGKNIFEGIIS